MIARGQQIDYQQNWKGRGYDTYIFAAPVNVGGYINYVAVVVRSDAENRFYLHEVVDGNGDLIYKSDAPAAIKTGVTAQDGVTGTTEASLTDTNIPQDVTGINNNYTTELARNVQNVAVSPESSVGAATRGFADNPSPGEMVPSQNKSVTTNPFLTEYEKLEYNPAHERISTAEQNRRADNMFAAYDDAGTIRNWDEVAADRDREVTYGLVNRDAAAFTQNFANKAPNEVLLGQLPTDGVEYYQMSPDERATYNYLYATDKAKADEYMQWLYPQLTESQRDAETKAVHDWTQENAFNAVFGNVASVLTSPLKALSYGSQAADLIKTGKIDENAGYNRYSYLNNAVREATSENWGEVGTFAYQTGMSMADFLYNAFITGGLGGTGGKLAENISLAIMGASAAADTVIKQKDRGMDDTRAFVLGTAAGLAEVVTEKVSLEALLTRTNTNS